MSYDLSPFGLIAPRSSTVNPARDEALAKVLVVLPNVNHPIPMLKMKVDTGAQGNTLALRIYRNTFPGHVDGNGLPTGTKTYPDPTDNIQWSVLSSAHMVKRRLTQGFVLLMSVARKYLAYPLLVNFN